MLTVLNDMRKAKNALPWQAKWLQKLVYYSHVICSGQAGFRLDSGLHSNLQNNICVRSLTKPHHLSYLPLCFCHTSNFLPFFHQAPRVTFQDHHSYKVETLPKRKWFPLPVINSPLDAHLAPLSLSPSSCSLLLIVQGLTQATPAVLAAS